MLIYLQRNAIRTIPFVSFPIAISLSQLEYLFKMNGMYWYSGGGDASALLGQTLLCIDNIFALELEVLGSNLGTDSAPSTSLEAVPDFVRIPVKSQRVTL